TGVGLACATLENESSAHRTRSGIAVRRAVEVRPDRSSDDESHVDSTGQRPELDGAPVGSGTGRNRDVAAFGIDLAADVEVRAVHLRNVTAEADLAGRCDRARHGRS